MDLGLRATYEPLRVAVITGGSRGIGRATAIRLASRGFEVVAISRSKESLESLSEEYPDITCLSLDVTDARETDLVFRKIGEEIGHVDILVTSAGIYPRRFFLDQTPYEFSATLRTNVEGVANCIRAVLPGMLQRNRGRVIVLGSMADWSPIPGSSAYSASKGALHALVRGIAGEIDHSRYPNVLVNELTPGATRTAMSDYGQTPEEASYLVEQLVDLPAGGAHGSFFYNGKIKVLNETWKGALKRVLFRS